METEPQPVVSSSHTRSAQLQERCTVFATEIHATLKRLHITPVNRRPIEQCSGAAGSIGANYCEASEAESTKDFIHKVSITKKEVKECRHWIRILAVTNPEVEIELRSHWKEATELLLIFSKMIGTARKRVQNELKT